MVVVPWARVIGPLADPAATLAPFTFTVAGTSVTVGVTVTVVVALGTLAV